MLPAGLLDITADIYPLRVMVHNRKEQFIDVFTELAAIAKIQSENSSNEIVSGNSAPLNQNEQEIAGYQDALAQIHTDYADMDFRESNIL